jgi:hypothetical protein
MKERHKVTKEVANRVRNGVWQIREDSTADPAADLLFLLKGVFKVSVDLNEFQLIRTSWDDSVKND